MYLYLKVNFLGPENLFQDINRLGDEFRDVLSGLIVFFSTTTIIIIIVIIIIIKQVSGLDLEYFVIIRQNVYWTKL